MSVAQAATTYSFLVLVSRVGIVTDGFDVWCQRLRSRWMSSKHERQRCGLDLCVSGVRALRYRYGAALHLHKQFIGLCQRKNGWTISEFPKQLLCASCLDRTIHLIGMRWICSTS